MTIIIKNVQTVGTGDELSIKVKHQPSWLRRIFGARTYRASYRGSCTVWHNESTGRRCPAWMERALASHWTLWQWGIRK